MEEEQEETLELEKVDCEHCLHSYFDEYDRLHCTMRECSPVYDE